MGDTLATPDDVADLWRPLTDSEQDRIWRLIEKASGLLRQRAPWVDERIALFTTATTDPAALDPETVATVVATIVKRFLVNPDGATNTSESLGAASISKGFALRGDSDVRGELVVTASDLAALSPAQGTSPRIGTMRVRPRLAPPPVGVLGASGCSPR